MSDTAPQNKDIDPHAQAAQIATRVTVIGMILDIALGILKCVGGLLFFSQALFVDGIHSLSDAFSDLIVLAVMKASRRAPDQEHPYGHQRIETFGTMLLGSTLIAVGAALAWDNLERLFGSSDAPLPEWPILVAALLSIVGKEWIFRYTRRAGERIRSELIIANAWHSRTDAFSSVIVLVSTIGAMLGFVWLDALAAVVIAVIVGHVGWNFTWSSVKELVDTGIPAEEIERLKAIARETDGVHNVHELRTRKMGPDILLDVHLVVSPNISVSEGHQIGMHVVDRMRETLDDIAYINFHIDPENDDELEPTSLSLPKRQELNTLLEEKLGIPLPHGKLRLHYLRNKIHLELFLDEPFLSGHHDQLKELKGFLEPQPWFGSLRIWHGEPV
ncbi:cation diffusion facilitator family transporter [Marinobacter zhejiangensis]|uniref:Cation diffusion facilitator family transporter n=1 Tax=Marinobacter zhejiangensis TaxID=488535 RepID=A0A1I4NZA9_9GAMM|nr:cation diffusion facilitator family transporter [Marinobacter zhejiangensis]SFM20799.1 cation diffusion facilitator family transporter [Marinobacter zhejiangensis]